ncbi:MAG: sulfatase-like hydrolase/transferase [Alphaproteobacteria bacterium]
MASARPDIVLVMTDQQRADSLGYAGNRFVATPHLDALAGAALRFRQAVTPFPLCSPARACLWTGRQAHRHGITDNVYGEPDALGRHGEEAVFPVLRAAGYRTAYVGKWHLGEAAPAGIDRWEGYNSGASHWIDGPEGRTWRPHRETGQAIEVIRDWSDGPPFLLVVSFYPPHPPYDAPDRLFPRYRRSGIPHAAYYAAIDGIDECVGRLLAALDRRDPVRPAAVLFLSDHGETFDTGRGGKRSDEEAAVRIPLLLRAPAMGPADVDAPVSLLDVAPTLAGLAGVGFTGDGEDLRAIADAPAGRPGVVIENLVAERVASRQGNLRQLVGIETRRVRIVRSETAKLVLREAAAPLLFDLAGDPEERVDLLREDPIPAVADELLHLLETEAMRTFDADGRALAHAFRAWRAARPAAGRDIPIGPAGNPPPAR